MVMNFSDILGFKSTGLKRVGLLVSLGGGFGKYKYDQAQNTLAESSTNAFVSANLTPLVKITERIALKFNLGYKINLLQDYTYDGMSNADSNALDGIILTAGGGLVLNLGSNNKHSDWAVTRTNVDKKILVLKNQLDSIKEDMEDEDQDGVPNYLDEEPGTTPGVLVNTKGQSVDANKNGIPDEYEDRMELNRIYAEKDALPISYEDAAGKLLNNGYVNVYFESGIMNPPSYSLKAINFLIQYLKDHPQAKAKLIGYTDKIGESSFNEYLSLQRAKKVYDILVDSGVEESRLDFVGDGELPSGDSKEALQMQRKVTFRIF